MLSYDLIAKHVVTLLSENPKLWLLALNTEN